MFFFYMSSNGVGFFAEKKSLPLQPLTKPRSLPGNLSKLPTTLAFLYSLIPPKGVNLMTPAKKHVNSTWNEFQMSFPSQKTQSFWNTPPAWPGAHGPWTESNNLGCELLQFPGYTLPETSSTLHLNIFASTSWQLGSLSTIVCVLSPSQVVGKGISEASTVAPENEWLEDDRFLLEVGLFSGAKRLC